MLEDLLADGQFILTGVTWPTLKYTAPSNKIKVIVVDFTTLSSLTAAFHRQDAVLSCVPDGAQSETHH